MWKKSFKEISYMLQKSVFVLLYWKCDWFIKCLVSSLHPYKLPQSLPTLPQCLCPNGKWMWLSSGWISQYKSTAVLSHVSAICTFVRAFPWGAMPALDGLFRLALLLHKTTFKKWKKVENYATNDRRHKLKQDTSLPRFWGANNTLEECCWCTSDIAQRFPTNLERPIS
jgi:hypothetical protein